MGSRIIRHEAMITRILTYCPRSNTVVHFLGDRSRDTYFETVRSNRGRLPPQTV